MCQRLRTLGNQTLVEAILHGDGPEALPRRSEAKTGISLEEPRKKLPVRWDEQRRVYVG